MLFELALATAAAAAPGAPGAIPGVPGAPHPTLPEPDASATFKLVVEGTISDSLESHISGRAATCLVVGDGKVDDKATYQRGRAVEVQFDRYRKAVFVQRAGRTADSSLAVVVKSKRVASGATT